MKMKQFLLLLVFISTGLAHDRVRRLVDVKNAIPGQFPYVVSLQDIQSKQYICGGSILNERYILTAAYCILNQDPNNITILAGSHTKNQSGEYYQINNVVCHLDYEPEQGINNIAIIKVHKNITFNNFTKPIPLLTDANQIPCNADLTVSAWGTYSNSTINGVDKVFTIDKDILQFVEATQISPESCNLIFSRFFEDVKKITDDMFCSIAAPGHGDCHADSGSPAVYNGMLVGFVSWGFVNWDFSCESGNPEGYTNVTKFLNWIDTTMEEMNTFRIE